jgi:hypothetical protein
MGSPRTIEVLLFETFPEASLFARQLVKRSAKVVRLWPDARGWLVENLAAERGTHDVDFCGHEYSERTDPYDEEIAYQERQRLMDDPKFPGEEAYSLGGDLNEDWMLDHG